MKKNKKMDDNREEAAKQAAQASSQTDPKADEKKADEQQAPETEAEQIESLGKKCMQLNEQYLRLSAEFDNYRRRTAKERLEMVATASEDVIKGLLPVLDDFERAVTALKDSTDAESAKEGTELIYNKLMAYLKGKGLEIIDAAGKDFDTDFHEAVAQFPAPDPSQKNKVIDIAQNGYTLNGKVIRYSKVVIGI